MERRTNYELLLLLILAVIMWGSYATATATRSRKLLTESKEEGEGEAEISTTPTTITFFMHHIIDGGKPGLGVGFPVGVQAGIGNIPGLVSPFGNNFNGNGNGNGNGINGPLPLTIPSGAINNSPLFGLPSTSTGLGGVQGLGLGIGIGSGSGSGSLTPGLINGQVNPQPALQGASGVPHDNVIVTVIEDTLTEGPDLHSSHVLGKGEGYYYHMPIAGSELEEEDEDHSALLLAFTAKFEGSEYADSSIEFAGKDKVGLPQNEITVVGGTGHFHNAQGHAVMETVSHTEVETVLKFTVTLAY